MGALLVFIMATLEICFGRKKLLDANGSFGGNVIQNPAWYTYTDTQDRPPTAVYTLYSLRTDFSISKGCDMGLTIYCLVYCFSFSQYQVSSFSDCSLWTQILWLRGSVVYSNKLLGPGTRTAEHASKGRAGEIYLNLHSEVVDLVHMPL